MDHLYSAGPIRLELHIDEDRLPIINISRLVAVSILEKVIPSLVDALGETIHKLAKLTGISETANLASVLSLRSLEGLEDANSAVDGYQRDVLAGRSDAREIAKAEITVSDLLERQVTIRPFEDFIEGLNLDDFDIQD